MWVKYFFTMHLFYSQNLLTYELQCVCVSGMEQGQDDQRWHQNEGEQEGMS